LEHSSPTSFLAFPINTLSINIVSIHPHSSESQADITHIHTKIKRSVSSLASFWTKNTWNEYKK